MMKKVIKSFNTLGGNHCVTNSLKQIFYYYGHPTSEEMLFGIGAGLNFVYVNLAASPMVSGRSKVMEFEETIAKQLGIKIICKKHKNYDQIFNITKEMINHNEPVLVYTDMPFLPYFGLNQNSHFGGHSVVLFGYDDDAQCFYVSDRDNADHAIRTPQGFISEDFHLVSYDQMQKARSSNFRPFPANNKYVTFDFTAYHGITKDMLISSITNVCEKMLNPAASLMGVSGIKKFSKEVIKWRKFDQNKLKRAGITNYFQINGDGGTGGGIFRNMYGRFLIEAADQLKDPVIERLGGQFAAAAKKWDEVGDKMWTLSETGSFNLLDNISDMIGDLYLTETEILTKLQQRAEYKINGEFETITL